MRGLAGFWDIDERYVRLSEAGDPLEKLNMVVPWEVFRKPLSKALKRSDFPPNDSLPSPSSSVLRLDPPPSDPGERTPVSLVTLPLRQPPGVGLRASQVPMISVHT